MRDYPFTIILGLVGVLLGLTLPSGLDYFTDGSWMNVSNPEQMITGAVIGLPIAMFIEVISGLIGGLILGLVGLIIDLIKNSGWE